VTSIGGTISVPTVNGTEIGVTFSGGGFSNHFARQSYQESAVAAFLNSFAFHFCSYVSNFLL